MEENNKMALLLIVVGGIVLFCEILHCINAVKYAKEYQISFKAAWAITGLDDDEAY